MAKKSSFSSVTDMLLTLYDYVGSEAATNIANSSIKTIVCCIRLLESLKTKKFSNHSYSDVQAMHSGGSNSNVATSDLHMVGGAEAPPSPSLNCSGEKISLEATDIGTRTLFDMVDEEKDLELEEELEKEKEKEATSPAKLQIPTPTRPAKAKTAVANSGNHSNLLKELFDDSPQKPKQEQEQEQQQKEAVPQVEEEEWKDVVKETKIVSNSPHGDLLDELFSPVTEQTTPAQPAQPEQEQQQKQQQENDLLVMEHPLTITEAVPQVEEEEWKDVVKETKKVSNSPHGDLLDELFSPVTEQSTPAQPAPAQPPQPAKRKQKKHPKKQVEGKRRSTRGKKKEQSFQHALLSPGSKGNGGSASGYNTSSSNSKKAPNDENK